MFNLVKEREGFTLIELIVAVSLLGIVVVGVAGIDLAGRRSLIAANRRARVQDWARHAMEHMVRNIRLCNDVWCSGGDGIPAEPPEGSSNAILVRMDYNPSSYYYNPATERIEKPLSLKTPDNFDDDYEVEYKYNANRIEWRYRTPPWTAPSPGEWSSWETIAKDVFDPDDVTEPYNLFDVKDGANDAPIVTIIIKVRHFPDQPKSANNPEATLQTATALWCKGRSL